MRKQYRYIFACMLLLGACKKEAALTPSDAEDNLLTVKDNPADPTDHAIYQFFQSTGIPCFYNDTLSKKTQVDINGTVHTSVTLLKVYYSPGYGVDTRLHYSMPDVKSTVVPMLNLIKNELLPQIPTSVPLRSILFVDEMYLFKDMPIPYGENLDYPAAFAGFSGLVLKVVNPDTMDAASRKRWAGLALAALCFKKMTNTPSIDLPATFYSISRDAFQNEIYYTEFTGWYPDGSKVPEDFGILDHTAFLEFILTCSEQEDLKIYLNELFSYSKTELAAKYAAYPVVIQKLDVLRPLVASIGFKIPD